MLKCCHLCTQPAWWILGKKDRKGNAVIKPDCVLLYNKGMGGVDRSDQRASTYQCVRKHVKWYKKLFFYVLDMCVLDSYLVHRELGGAKFTLLAYRSKLISELIDSSSLPAYCRRGRPSSLDNSTCLLGRHFPEELPPTQCQEKPRRRCTVCTAKGSRKDTRYQCDKCQHALCIHPCFCEYHTKTDYTK